MSIDNSNKINGFQSSVKWAIINNRDVSLIGDSYLSAGLKNISDQMNTEIQLLSNDLFLKIAKPLEDAVGRKDSLGKYVISPTIHDSVYQKLLLALIKFTKSQSENDFKNLEQAFSPYKNVVKIDVSIFSEYHQKRVVLIDSLASQFENEIKKRGIITLGFNSNYVNKNWDSLSVRLEWIKGIGGKKDSTKPWDIYAGAFYSFKKDTLLKQPLQRHILTLKLGLNKVLANRSDGSPLFEILGAAQYDNIIKGDLYTNEKRSTLAADFTFTIKVSKAVSVPLEIKYDPANKGNLYGFLNLKWDILTSASK